MRTTRTVPLYQWENGNYFPKEFWEVTGYSEYVGNGPTAVPRYAELQQIELPTERKLKLSSDDDIIAILTAIFQRKDWDGNESAPYPGCQNMEHWSELVYSEANLRGLKYATN
jgi:hypothetical protein